MDRPLRVLIVGCGLGNLALPLLTSITATIAITDSESNT